MESFKILQQKSWGAQNFFYLGEYFRIVLSCAWVDFIIMRHGKIKKPPEQAAGISQ